jgi:hypothetical protein
LIDGEVFGKVGETIRRRRNVGRQVLVQEEDPQTPSPPSFLDAAGRVNVPISVSYKVTTLGRRAEP